MNYQTILVAVDMEPESAATISYAFALGEKVGATVHTLQASPFAGSREASIAHAKQELEKVVASHRASPSLGQCRVSVSEPISAILETAEAVCADLIILSTHGRRGVGRLLIGSVAEGVLQETNVPVLIVKAPPATQRDSTGHSSAPGTNSLAE